jgi:hypothetical protein
MFDLTIKWALCSMQTGKGILLTVIAVLLLVMIVDVLCQTLAAQDFGVNWPGLGRVLGLNWVASVLIVIERVKYPQEPRGVIVPLQSVVVDRGVVVATAA